MTAGLRKAPTFDMFSPSYIKDLESFTVRMPTTYVHILLQSRPFSAGDVIKFLLEPKVYDQQGKDKKTDTGDFWAHVSIHPHSVMTQADMFAFIKSQFWRVALNPVNVEAHKDKKSGAGTNKIRVGFLPTERLDVRNLKSLHELKAPDGFTMYTRFSNIGAKQFGIHPDCLGILSDQPRFFHFRCNCGDKPKQAGSSSGADRAKAKAAFQERALKRAREEPDPFA